MGHICETVKSLPDYEAMPPVSDPQAPLTNAANKVTGYTDLVCQKPSLQTEAWVSPSRRKCSN